MGCHSLAPGAYLWPLPSAIFGQEEPYLTGREMEETAGNRKIVCKHYTSLTGKLEVYLKAH